jgi:hypothetical protein
VSGEHAPAGTLQSTSGKHVHHFTSVADYRTEVVLHIDSAVGPFLEFLFEVFHQVRPVASFRLGNTELHEKASCWSLRCQQGYAHNIDSKNKNLFMPNLLCLNIMGYLSCSLLGRNFTSFFQGVLDYGRTILSF